MAPSMASMRRVASRLGGALHRAFLPPTPPSSPCASGWRSNISGPPSSPPISLPSAVRFYSILRKSEWVCVECPAFGGVFSRLAVQEGIAACGSGVRCFASSSRFGNSGRVDVGARARQLQARRLWTILLGFSVVAGFAVVVLANFEEYLMFYITPTDALEKYVKDPAKSRCRLGGLVLEGSVVHFSDSPEMEFVVTDLANDILVRYKGALPDLFREGHSVVVEGYLRPMSVLSQKSLPQVPSGSLNQAVTQKARSIQCYFAAVEVLAKHDEKYMPKEVAAVIERNREAIQGDIRQ
eukprot:c26711_g2_i1 orf=202-1089(+)